MTKALQPDDLIGHYRVIRALGAGGMGEVYLARDSALDRDVALKVLPQMAQDDDRVRRFVLEAKSASSLSHPHIITVYEIGFEPVQSADGSRTDKVHYIAMELVSGDTLADLIHENKADLKTLLGYLAQAADGLAKAHASGIVHRDLKPGNIMVSKDGYAKILDFGLAKLVETPARDATIPAATRQALTVEGMIVGTIGYMAPEQILGRAVDHRTDIFAFGCILYEAVTRRRPFAADSQFEALQKIIGENPAPIEMAVPDAPAELRHLIGRCLAKQPDERIGSMKDVAAELRRVGSSEPLSARSGTAADATVYYAPIPPGMAPSTVVQPPVVPTVVIAPRAKRRLAAIAGGIVLVLALSGFLLYKFGFGRRAGLSEQAISQMKVNQVLGNELLQGISVSPDGRYAAYVTLVNAKRQLKVRQISTGKDIPIIDAQDSAITGLTFSPDGDHLWYVSQDTGNALYSSLYEVPSLGGDPQRRVSDADTEPTFSPDGKSIAFIRGRPQEKKTSLIVALENGTDARVVATLPAEQDNVLNGPRWSPDGKKIAVVFTPTPRKPDVAVFDVASGSREDVGKWDGPTIDSLAWLGPDGLVVCGASAPGPNQLWYVAYPGGDRRRLTNDIADYAFVSASADGRTIAARRTQRAVEIWRVPTNGAPSDMKQSTEGKENISSIAASTDGTLVFNAPLEDSMTLWSRKPGGTGRTSIAPKGASVLYHRFIHGQDATAFTAFGPDLVGHIWRVDVDGSNLQQLTKGAGENIIAVTPDGKYLLYNTPQAPRTLMARSADGSGTPRQIASDYIDTGRDPLIFSRDGRLISYNRIETSQQQVVMVRVVMSFQDGRIAGTYPPRFGYQFTPDATAFTYIQPPQAATPKTPASTAKVMKVALAGGEPRMLFEMPESRLDVQKWLDDKTMILGAFSTTKQVSNLWRWTSGMSKPVPLTDFRDGLLFEFIASQDGKSVYFTQGSLNRDIIKITGLKQ